MNEIIEIQNELLHFFEAMVEEYNKRFQLAIPPQKTFLSPELRQRFLREYSNSIKDDLVLQYLKMEERLEEAEKNFLEKVSVYLEAAEDIDKNGLTLSNVDMVFSSLQEAYQYYLSHFKDVNFSVNKDSAESPEQIIIGSSDIENSLHRDVDFSLSIPQRNINHLLEVTTYKQSQRRTKKDNILKILYGEFSTEKISEKSFIEFICNDALKYIKYFLGENEVTEEEKIKLDKIAKEVNIKEELNDFFASMIIKKSVSFLFVHKYKYLPELILDYEGIADFDIYNKSKDNSLTISSSDGEGVPYELRTTTLATSLNSVTNHGNPNYWIASYNSDEEVTNTLKVQYYTLLSLIQICESLVDVNADLPKPSTNYLDSFNNASYALQALNQSSSWSNSVMALSIMKEELSSHHISDPNVERCINVEYLFDLFLEVSEAVKNNQLSYDLSVKPKDYEFYKQLFGEFTNPNSRLNEMKKSNISIFNYIKNIIGSDGKTDKKVEMPEIRYLIPVVHDLFQRYEGQCPVSNMIGIVFNEDNNYAKTNQQKTFIQLVLDLRVRGRSYKIDSVYSDEMIYQMTTVRQYENRSLMIGNNRLTPLSSEDFSFPSEINEPNKKTSKKAGIFSKILPFVFTSALVASGISFNKETFDIDLFEEDTIEKVIEQPIITQSAFLPEGTIYKESSDANYGGAGNFGIVGTILSEGNYKINGISLIYNGQIVYSNFDDRETLEHIKEKVADELKVNSADFEIYVHMDNPVYGWVDIESIKYDDHITEENIIKTSYQSVANSNNDYAIINKNGEDIYFKFRNDLGEIVEPGTIVIGSDGEEYIIDKIEKNDDSVKMSDAILSAQDLSDYTISFNIKDANPVYALGIALATGNYLYRRRR